jgi:predicted DNA-binding protein (MmcQ/YjbR family)
MNIEVFREYCLAKKGVEETFPFDEVTLVFKVMGKIFAITGLDDEEFKVNLKCDPERSTELRALYPDDIMPGWHMNKLHWNTVRFESDLDAKLLKELIDHSYDLIVAKLPKKVRESMKDL